MQEANRPLLVVDDEAMNRDLLSRRLERAGYAVEVASDAKEALARIEASEIELVLLDHMMPGVSGLDLLKLLRATYSPAQLPVIMVTALKDSENVAEALHLGANDYITKPIDFQIALARIRSQLNRKRAEDALRQSEERYALAARGAKDGLWDWDLLSNRIYFSPRWKQMLGCEDSEISDNPAEWLNRVHKDDQDRLHSELRAQREASGSGEFASEHRLLHKDGDYRWVLCRGVVQRGKDGRAIRMAGSQTDVTRNKAFDPLTGLPNRVMFNDCLAAAMERGRQDQRNSFAVLFLDLDHFKDINDSFGHMVGDELLVQVAGRLRGAVRTSPSPQVARPLDVVARLGGDEFAILLEYPDILDAAGLVSSRIQAEMERPFSVGDTTVFTSVSIGIACGHQHYQSPVEILRDADTAMYRAKHLGRARSEVFDEEMRASAIDRLQLMNDLPLALERGEFVLYYQPKVRLPDGALLGFEALVRWQHPTRGLLVPAKFIPLTEETGHILRLGRWILREACATLRQWQAELSTASPLEISVNLSAKQFRDPGLAEDIETILRETGLAPTSLQLEVTESVLIEDADAVATALARLKALGVGFKIDDFGTGYSSLNYLHLLPFDALKIDGSFVMGLGRKDNSNELVKAILSLGESLGMEVVAEGIETPEQAAALSELGCLFGQGFLFSRPVPAADARSLVERALNPEPAS
jgi:diguanylate cyclase (GGDEF)-like protein/PAS domain S-box-containing protein